MDVRALFVLSVLGLTWCCDARDMVTTDRVSQENIQKPEGEVRTSEIGRKEQVCALCEQFTGEALNYIAKNKTQTEIIEILHKSCSRTHFKHQCIALVDYYAALFFLEISSLQPEEFCQKVDLCEEVVSKFQHLTKDSCNLCHQAVEEILVKLKDPDTQLQIMEILLKACDAAESYAKKCKKLIFEYGPVIFVNAEHFLEKTDVCAKLHACDATASASEQSFAGIQESMHSAS